MAAKSGITAKDFAFLREQTCADAIGAGGQRIMGIRRCQFGRLASISMDLMEGSLTRQVTDRS